MQVRCPQCRNSVEIRDDSSLRAISCSTCGSSFDIVDDETKSFEFGKVNDETTSLRNDPSRNLGHFELLEKLGAGGFGTVWKARDSKLERIVAVKIPRKEHLSAQDTEHFLREARAAAQLKHPCIVGVHEIGKEDDTVFIVSDYVEGLTLTDWLDSQRPSVDDAVRLIVKVADALDTAHENGVVHRDLKPSNIILDEKDVPHVMDFGLAKREFGDITMTVEGQILGTPAYMAPEQALGDSHKADRRADVYALGVILFELVTGERPFRGNARMLLHQVANDEAPSPRKLVSHVPRDLETIILRCLEKEPAKRFATAAEFSADLRRFLSNEPVQSRPVGRIERAIRLCKRNPIVASLSGGVAIVTLIGIIVTTSLWLRAESIAKREREARIDLGKEKIRADENLEQAQQVVFDFFTEVSESKELLRGTPGTQQLRLDLLRKAKDYYEQFIAKNDSPKLSANLAESLHYLGSAFHELGMIDEAEETYLRAISTYKELREEYPEVEQYEKLQAYSNYDLSLVYRAKGQPEKEARQMLVAKELLERLLEKYPNDPSVRESNALVYSNLAGSNQMELDIPKAIQCYERAINLKTDLANEFPAYQKFEQLLVTDYCNLGNLYATIGDREEAIQSLDRALDIDKRLGRERPFDGRYQVNITNCRLNLGYVVSSVGDIEGAKAHYEMALQESASLSAENPLVPDYGYCLALSHTSLGMFQELAGGSAEAGQHFDAAIVILEELVEGNPDRHEYRSLLAQNFHQIGVILSEKEEFIKARDFHERAYHLRKELVDAHSTIAKYEMSLARSQVALGAIHHNLDQLDDALTLYESAVRIGKQLVEEYPLDLDYPSILVEVYSNLCVLYLDRELTEDAKSAIESSISYGAALVDQQPENVRYAYGLASSHYNHGICFEALNLRRDAVREFESAMIYVEPLVRKNPSRIKYRLQLINAYKKLADLYRSSGNSEDAELVLGKLIAEEEQLVALVPNESDYAYELSISNAELATVYQLSNRVDDAEAQYRLALAKRRQLVSEHPENDLYRVALGGNLALLGMLLSGQEKFEESFDLFHSASSELQYVLERNPLDPNAQAYLNNARVLEGMAYNRRAWLLAVSPDDEIRDGEQAVEDATKACEIAEWTKYEYIETLAAAYAEAGDFENAIRFQLEAVAFAPPLEKQALEAVVEHYRNGRPRREPTKPVVPEGR